MSQTEAEINTVLARDLLPVAHNRIDRLPPMLFVAALFYAMLILGVTFDIGLPDDDREATSLEVTIVTNADLTTARPDKADYLAQANQQGNGNTREKVSPGAAPLAPGQTEINAEEPGQVQRAQSPGEVVAKELLTTTASAERVILQPDEVTDEQSELAQEAQAVAAGQTETLPLPEDDNPSLLITDDNPRHLVVSVNSAQSDIAPYLNSWKRRVERIGTLNFPRGLNVEGLTGSPTLEISIAPDGRLTEVQILRSSGYEALDRAAMMVLSRASPFDAFPEVIKEQYDLLRFAYKFEFQSNRMRGTVSTSADGR
ncbi:MAG: cell envelope integrity protein TolA [Woeseiaceae bacterium]